MNVHSLASLESWQVIYKGLSTRQRLTALCVALLSGGLLWFAAHSAGTSTMSVLTSPTDAKTGGKVISKLSEVGIKADVDSQGRVLVPSEKLDEARLAAAEGASDGARMGFELFDKANFSSSEFDERVNYQRALESELEQTIRTLGDVQNARVHLVMPEYSLYEQRDRPAKASVTIATRAGALDKKSARAIRNLVSGAVPGLDAGGVSIIGTDGALYTPGDSSVEEDEEASLQAKLVSTLEGVVGPGKVRASVVVERQTSEVLTVEEAYDKSSAVPLSVQRSEQRTEYGIPQGVAGTAANLPANGRSAAGKAEQGHNSTSETSTYGVNRSTRRSVEPGGQVKRISAAIVVDDSGQSRSKEEVASLRELAIACIGIDSRRGDVLELKSVKFTKQETPPQTSDRYTSVWRALQRSSGLLRTIVVCLALLLVGLCAIKPLAQGVANAIQTSELRLPPLAQAMRALDPSEESIDELKSRSLSSVLEKPDGARQVIAKWLQGGA